MRITTVRRLSQVFFFVLFVWFCIAATLGERWWQLRGWPVNWFLQLDPLIALSVWLTTHTVYAGLLWSVATVALTLMLGRFFCGWVCPFGSAQHFMGWVGGRGADTAALVARNRPHRAQGIKYLLLAALLGAAGGALIGRLSDGWRGVESLVAALLLFGLIIAGLRKKRRAMPAWIGAAALFAIAAFYAAPQRWLAASLQSGLLDPIALIHRSFNLVLLPIADAPLKVTAAAERVYAGAGLIGLLFVLVLLLSTRVPRFYCRFICPLGALFGWLARISLWRIGRAQPACTECTRCEKNCEGACTPATGVRLPECVLCLNCLKECRHGAIGYRIHPSDAGGRTPPDPSRRQVVAALAAGLAAVPVLRVGGAQSTAWNPALIRPPGALEEKDFLARCIKCAQCMRICPTNAIHPAGLQGGLEALWTPVLDFRSGTSGCQHNCVACTRVCPTAALRPLAVDERMGRGAFAQAGPLRIGMAFVDYGRCLPWAMDTPCIVCQENCPVSPKAIFTREALQPVRGAPRVIRAAEGDTLVLEGGPMDAGQYAGGDFFVQVGDLAPRPVLDNGPDALVLGPLNRWPGADRLTGRTAHVLIRLQRPYVDPRRCIGCGVCEHECPVQGQRAIRVSAENESRHKEHQMVLG